MKTLFLLCIVFLSNIEIFAQNKFEIDQKVVQFENNGVQLSGIIVFPKTDKKVPLVILVPNSWSTRFIGMAEYYAKNGIACFTYDSRDAGKSMGFDCYKDSIVELYAQDLQIVIKKIRNHKDFSKIGVWGISMGGWIIERALLKENVDFSIMISTQTMSINKSFEWMVASFTKNKVDTNKINSLKTQWENVKNTHDYEFNPYDNVKKIKTPSLWIFGENDLNISVDQTVSDLEAIKNKNKITIKTYKGIDHAGVGESDVVLNDIINWIKK